MATSERDRRSGRRAASTIYPEEYNSGDAIDTEDVNGDDQGRNAAAGAAATGARGGQQQGQARAAGNNNLWDFLRGAVLNVGRA